LDLLESIAHGAHGDGAISVEGVCPMNPANHPRYTRWFRACAASEISTDKENGRLKQDSPLLLNLYLAIS
jgi:hypothetical protein